MAATSGPQGYKEWSNNSVLEQLAREEHTGETLEDWGAPNFAGFTPEEKEAQIHETTTELC